MNDAFYERLATGSQIVAAILFVVVLVYLWRRFLTPAVAAAQARKNAELEEAEQRRDAARSDIDAARRELAAAEADARSTVTRGEEEAARTRERILAEARAESERVARNADGELDRARTAARERLRGDLLEKAIAIAREAAQHVDERTNRRLVAETVDSVDRPGSA